ncbi:MAG: TetR/AcrR family transcriptional regulator [Trichloromonas sp.]|jgi:AcrR family transcriptional regulator|nr:TetR/AcrR family transcriptional regulator [Trichloromonas sp.]
MSSCKSEDKRCALLQAALELFAAQGFDGTATTQIAKQAGVASGTLFFHFKSKEELIHELYREVRGRIEVELREPVGASISLRERLLHSLEKLLLFLLNNPREFKFIEQYYFSPFSEREVFRIEENNIIHHLLIQAREQQIVKEAPLMVLEALVFGPITALAKDHANRGAVIDEEIRRLTIQSCWDGIKR